MPRYLTFDEKTASAVRAHVPEQQVFEHGAEGAVDYALHADRDIVAVVPTGAARVAAVAVFRKPKAAAQPALSVTAKPPSAAKRPAADVEARKPVASVPLPPRQNTVIRAGGFLGLRDEAVFEEDQPAAPKKQSWWRKLWPEDE